MKHEIIRAIQQQRLLTFHYDGQPRQVEPHRYGTSTRDRTVLRAYQIGGGSCSDEPIGWKLFAVESIRDLQVSEETFEGPRQGYTLKDSQMTRILAELSFITALRPAKLRISRTPWQKFHRY